MRHEYFFNEHCNLRHFSFPVLVLVSTKWLFSWKVSFSCFKETKANCTGQETGSRFWTPCYRWLWSGCQAVACVCQPGSAPLVLIHSCTRGKFASTLMINTVCLIICFTFMIPSDLVGVVLHVHRVSLVPAAIDVHVNRCLDTIVAGGVQICGLHATVAPRRQQQQSPPVLEEFVFVPYVETKCLSGNGKLAEKLKLCKGTSKMASVVLAAITLMFNQHYIQCTGFSV